MIRNSKEILKLIDAMEHDLFDEELNYSLNQMEIKKPLPDNDRGFTIK